MESHFGINPNCSEAVIRINLTEQNRKQIDALYNKLCLELNQCNDSEEQEWEDIIEKKEFDWSDASVNEKTIFGISVLEINGDAPYNMGSEIETVIRRYLPKARIEGD
jgi:hypothetical protein